MADVAVEALNASVEVLMNKTEDNVELSIQEQIDVLKTNMDVFFLLIISFIVFFLQGGFAFLEVGSVRSKNATNILIKNMLDVFIGGIAFWLIGYPLAFGKGNGVFGTTYWASAGLPKIKLAHWCFQFVFAATAATIVSGSVAERCAFNAYFIYSTLLTGFVYPIMAHWAWSDDGWLAHSAYHDFAGSGVVHLTGGISALVGAMMLGPRKGRFKKPGSSIKGHSLPLAGLGGFILLFGFLAFNGGSQGSISNPGDAEIVARAVVNTIISGCFGGIAVLFIYSRGSSTWSFLMTLNGALTGMVSICAGCDVIYSWGAMLTGLFGGMIYLAIHYLMEKLKIDDPLDAVAVHMGGGMWGLLSTAFFMEGGILLGYTEGFNVLLWNIIGLITVLAWAGGFCILMFGTLRHFNMLRVSEEEEVKGLDILKHGEAAYPVESWYEEQYYSKCKTDYNKSRKIRRRDSKIPAHMNPPPPAPSERINTIEEEQEPSASEDTFDPKYVPGPEIMGQFGLPNARKRNDTNTQVDNSAQYSNNGFEMDKV